MENIDFTLLRKRREKFLALRKETEQPQHIGICYAMTLDGKTYPVPHKRGKKLVDLFADSLDFCAGIGYAVAVSYSV